jgi:cation diffusion facilitator CzcD-associated flavoprotein CzcO
VPPQGEESKWEVTTQSADGRKETRSFDAVAVCCGTHQVPKRPSIEGVESFGGDVDHSYQFWNASKYAGKNVAVVGMGESSADVVRDISDVSASCHLVLRSYPMCVPRLLPDGHPADSMTSRLFYPNRTDSFLVWGFAAIIAFVLWAPLVLLGFVKEHLKWPYPTDAFGQTKETYMDVRTTRTKELVALLAFATSLRQRMCRGFLMWLMERLRCSWARWCAWDRAL